MKFSGFFTRCVATLAVFGAAALGFAREKRVGLLLDQPPGQIMQTASDSLAEIAEKLDAANDDFSIEIICPVGDGTFRTRDGEPTALENFDVLWISQEDEIGTGTALFSEESQIALKAYFDGDARRAVLLTGAAAPLLETFDFGPVQTTAKTFGQDRDQAGVLPIRADAPIFENADFDRGVVWLSNAAFTAFQRFVASSPRLKTLATTPEGGLENDLVVGLDGGEKRVRVAAFAWRISPLYWEAPETYRQNFETLYINLLRCVGSDFDPTAATAPAFVLPDFEPLRRALNHFAESFSEDEYPDVETRLAELDRLEAESKTIGTADGAAKIAAKFAALQKAALLANPELDFDELLFIRRNPKNLGLPTNYEGNSSLAPTGYGNDLSVFNFRTGESSVLFKPQNDEFLGDVELHYDADKLLFSSPDVAAGNRWRVWELPLNAENAKLTAGTPTVLPLIDETDVDNYDACYLPDGRVIFCSSACFSGVPCINGVGHVCNLYIKELDGSVRQLTIEQDHDWYPTVLNNGRIMYLRWEYSDLPHAFSRILFHMNPDGTNQAELYGSGSYWPNAIFFARPIPGDPSKFVGIVAGHHEINRRGDLVLFDPSLGRQENEGAIQRIPGYGKKVEAVALDLPIAQTWPKFLHPYPVSETTFIVSCQRSASSPWTLCLVDVFDNIVTLKEEPEFALLEPVPFRETERQPIVSDRIDRTSETADVFIADLYEGEGLKGVPRGTVKSLRIFSYHFGYQEMGAEPYSVGLDGPWDPRRILGTVPVCEDGSVSFKVPAYTPFSIQPLDAEGKAVQLMRSWITAQPGEPVSCVGCHEKQNSTSPTNPRTMAAQSKPVEIAPFYGPARGFSFNREVQPVLDRYCVDCHQAEPQSEKLAEIFGSDPIPELPDFRTGPAKPLLDNGNYINQASRFSPSYYQLRRFVRTPTKESQMATLNPYEFHADMTQLMQILQNGHYGVELDQESWDRLITWIDLNAPFHGNWNDVRGGEAPELVQNQWRRRTELRRLYASTAASFEDDPTAAPTATAEISPESTAATAEVTSFVPVVSTVSPQTPTSKNAADAPETLTIPLSETISLELVRVPGADYYAGRFEVTNEQFALYDPTHKSGMEFGDFIHFSPGERGWSVSRAEQPVVRVSWNEAEAFCRWLSEKTGREFFLPTAEQWKNAAAAGTTTPFWFGGADADYSTKENLADSRYSAIDPFGWEGRVETLPAWRPSDVQIDDRSRVSARVGSYAPNPWGLFDVQGNAAEWTSTEETLANGDVKKVVCGGSWTTPARYGTIDAKRSFRPFTKPADVGFRVFCAF